MGVFNIDKLYKQTLHFQKRVDGLLKRTRSLSNEILKLGREYAANQPADFSKISIANRELAQTIHRTEDLNSIPVGISIEGRKELSGHEQAVLDAIYDSYNHRASIPRKFGVINKILKGMKKRKKITQDDLNSKRGSFKPMDETYGENFVLAQRWAFKQSGTIWSNLNAFANGTVLSLDDYPWYERFKEHPEVMMDLCLGTVRRILEGNSGSGERAAKIQSLPKQNWIEANENIYTAIKAIVHFANLVK